MSSTNTRPTLAILSRMPPSYIPILQLSFDKVKLHLVETTMQWIQLMSC